MPILLLLLPKKHGSAHPFNWNTTALTPPDSSIPTSTHVLPKSALVAPPLNDTMDWSKVRSGTLNHVAAVPHDLEGGPSEGVPVVTVSALCMPKDCLSTWPNCPGANPPWLQTTHHPLSFLSLNPATAVPCRPVFKPPLNGDEGLCMWVATGNASDKKGVGGLHRGPAAARFLKRAERSERRPSALGVLP